MPDNIRPRLTHSALFCWDFPKMKDFYEQIVCQTVADQGQARSATLDMVFFTNDPDEHHQFVLVSGRPEDVEFSTCQQSSFRIDTLEELRTMHDHITKNGVQNIRTVTHGNAFSIYFDDPEGNNVEIYMPTPWHVPQPNYLDIDFTKSDEQIMAETEARCREDPGFMTREARQKVMADRIGG